MKSTAPAKNPCGSCPYRRDVPSGVWSDEEYAKLPHYDNETPFQPPAIFLCHQQDGRVCAGWAGCHDMGENLGVRVASAVGILTLDIVELLLDYSTPVELFKSGAEAAAHGRRDIKNPSEKACATVAKIEKRQEVADARSR